MLGNVSVEVRPTYLPEHSAPDGGRYVFAYTVVIENRGTETVQLMTRHWIITDGNGRIEEVRGDGVVGEQPVLEPGASFQYTSGCILETPRGTMHGSYQLVDPDGQQFDAEIPAFVLATPGVESDLMLN